MLKFRCALIIALAALGTACSQAPEPDAAPVAEAAATPEVDPLAVAEAHPGEAPYQQTCAACHDQAVYKAPSRTFLAMLGPTNVLAAMEEGLMQEQSASLSEEERRAVAEYVTGQTLADAGNIPQAPRCEGGIGFDPARVPTSLGWGVDAGNARFQPSATGGLDRDDLENLEVKWAFAYPNAIQARSQPAFGGGLLYFGSNDGTVRAVDADSGCLVWTFKANGEVRNAIVMEPWPEGVQTIDPTIYFADIVARVYAVSARTGELKWSAKVDDHPDATVTGAVALHDGRLYVPVSSLEVVSAIPATYACCTFRGSVVALNAATGEQVWKAHTIDEVPSKAGENRVGTDILAPSGAPG